MTEVTKTTQETDVVDGVVRLLLQLDLPAALRRRPPARALVLANLMQNAREEDLRRDSLHTVRLVEVSVALVEVLVVDLEVLVLVVALLLRPLRDDVRLEVEERAGVRLAGERGLADEDVGDVLEDPFNDEESFDKGLLDRCSALRLLAATRLELSGTLAGEGDPATEVVHEGEDGLQREGVSSIEKGEREWEGNLPEPKEACCSPRERVSAKLGP